MKLQDIIDCLETAPRQGFVEDAPEGSRYIQISDTLVASIVALLKEHVNQDEPPYGHQNPNYKTGNWLKPSRD